MKKLLVAMLFWSQCFAATVATMPNNANGMFVLTDIPCKNDRNTFIAYTTSPNNPTAFGCWFVDDNFVHIIWDSVGVRSYKFNDWKTQKKDFL